MGRPVNVIDARFGVAAALAFVSGAVDVIGWLSLDHLYTAHMTGNSAALGQAIARGDARAIVTRGLPAVVFMAGVVGGATLAEACIHRGVRAAVAPGLALTAALLVGFLAGVSVTAYAGPVPLEPAWAFDLQASLVSLAMGVQTATFRRIDGVTVRTTYITGMLTNFAEELAQLLARPRDAPVDLRSTARHLVATGLIWPSFVAGAAVSALAYARWRAHALAIPVLLLVSLVVLDLAWPMGGPSGTAAWRREQRRRSGE
ncbi:YoaK family protein [Sorangium atrum]|uniref:YoaK family protein n=1 Tax=Sorangium atrum TaxID=2995308 RepID=A0ABT5C9V2_9BACT|nr:YoaK family protein [Sorangium aterium]MDC0682743.1 YoaK family protein [Sorangium aterium]